LRLVIANQASVNESALKQLGARGFVRPSAETLQVVVGPIADQVASDIRDELKAPTSHAAQPISAAALLEALGGRANVREAQLAASRILVAVKDANAVVDARIAELTLRGVARPARDSLHFVLGPSAGAVFQELNAIL
jgi:PTS system N-acetylglucosamine-specific IIC component